MESGCQAANVRDVTLTRLPIAQTERVEEDVGRAVGPWSPWNAMDVEYVSVELLWPPRVFMSPPPSIGERGDFPMSDSELRDPGSVGSGESGLGTETWSCDEPLMP